MSHKILKVIARGFKSHWDSTFEYSEGLTVVTGPTDSGKSAGVMQPIKWVAYGEPAGEDFLFTIRNEETMEIVRQAERAEVIIEMDSGHIIRKLRRKGKTSWFVNDMENPISEKAEVPEEVKEILGLTKQAYGDFETSLNLAYQLEAPFLISETPSVGAKVLGKLAGTEIVDKAIGSIGKKVHRAREAKSLAVKTIDQANVGLVEYLDLEEKITVVEASEALILQLDKDAARAAQIRQQQARYNVVHDNLITCNLKLDRLAVIPAMYQHQVAIDHAMVGFDGIARNYVQYVSLDESISAVNIKLGVLAGVGVAATLFETVTNGYVNYASLSSLVVAHSSIDTRIVTSTASLQGYEGLQVASELLEGVVVATDTMVSLRKLNSDFATYSHTSELLHMKLAKCADLKAANALLQQVCGTIERLEAVKGVYSDYAVKAANVARLTTQFNVCQDSVISATAELGEAWGAAGGYCPLCSQTVDAVHAH